MSDDNSVIRIIGLVNGGETEFDGQYLTEYDPTRDGVSPSGEPMLCHLRTTPDIDKAARFTTEQAFETWKLSHGVRPDGRPSRPLSAFSVEIFDPAKQAR